MPYFEAKDQTSIYFYDWGPRTGQPVVLIHGWPVSSASWEYQARALADAGYRVIAYDRRGFGRSDWAAQGYEYDTLASDVNDLLTGLNLTGVTLVGFSMGGGEVARYLGTYGQSRVVKAVFISSVTPYLLKTDDNPDGVDQKVFDEILEGIEKDRPDYLHNFASKFYGRSAIHHSVSEAQINFFDGMAGVASPKATIECAKAFAMTDFRSDVAKITIPTLVIYGTKDGTVPPSASAERMGGLLANSETIPYEGEPHGLNVTAAEKLNNDLLTFLRANPRLAAL